jgi:enamine deaminase RidA (YjgF/YER057c/UK114 family)
MKREVIRPWPAMEGHNTPFVPALKVSGAGKLLFISGMGALPPVHKHPHVPEEWVLPDDAAEQARRALNKIRQIVEAAGGRFNHIVKITRYMKDIADQDAVNAVIHEYFGADLPCSTTVQVVGFVVPTMKIEIDAWAVIPD